MNCWSIRLLLAACCLLASVVRSPAPLIYQPGEGWTYEAVGGEGKWQKARAKDQLQVAKTSFEQKDYSTALKAARRTVTVWPFSDYAPEAQYYVGRCYEAKGNDERAFKEYQTVVQRYPRIALFQEVQQRQFDITAKFLAGKRFRPWQWCFPMYRSMEKTAGMYEKIVSTGPYSDIAPQAQLKAGVAYEKGKKYPEAVKAYERAADRYSDRPEIAAEAMFSTGIAYWKQSQKSEYDQSTAAAAIDAFTDFMTLFPVEPRVKQAQGLIDALHAEQARGSYEIAKFYEQKQRYAGAMVYYNEVLLLNPLSHYADESRKRIDELKARITATPK